MKQMNFNLKVTSGPGVGTSFVLSNGTALNFGRLESNDFVLSGDSGISRSHFQISFADGRYWIKDLNSRNGTYLNHHSVLTSELNSGDEIRAGRTTMTVSLTDSNCGSAAVISGLNPNTRLAVQFDETTLVIAERSLATTKVSRDLIQNDEFAASFFDLPGKAVLVNAPEARSSIDRTFDFETVGQQAIIVFPSSVEAVRNLRDTWYGKDAMLMLNHVCRRSQLVSQINDSFSKFERPTILLSEVEQLPTEISSGLLTGIDFVVCESSRSESASIVHESVHTKWLEKLVSMLSRNPV